MADFARIALVGLLALGACQRAESVDVRVAVAANFARPWERIAAEFTAQTGYRVATSVASTGKLYAQIVNGAPFDVLLAADSERPRRLESDGLGVDGSRFTYALGRLALVGRGVDPGDGSKCLREHPGDGPAPRLAIANPLTAPYGSAALETLAALGVAEVWSARLVRGENVAHAMHFVVSGAAELGLVSRAQVAGVDLPSWPVPASHHAPIRQQAVLLCAAADVAAARALLEFLRGARGRELVRSQGYDLPSD